MTNVQHGLLQYQRVSPEHVQGTRNRSQAQSQEDSTALVDIH